MSTSSNKKIADQANTKNLFLRTDKKIWISIILWTASLIVIFVVIGLMWGLTNIDWTQGNSFEAYANAPSPSYKNVKGTYGSFAVYPTTMTAGIILAIIASAYNFWRKGLDITYLSIGAIVCIPSSLFIASFFGKLNANIDSNESFWSLFEFWDEGMSIHGGVIGAMATGVPIFLFVAHKTKVSTLVYADAIVPNILLGQAIGRWGNFYNHEVMGAPVTQLSKGVWDGSWDNLNSSGLWLPKWITNNTTLVAKGDIDINGVHYESGSLVQMQPFFFYESISLFAAWLIIVFIIPNITKWMSKKPWKINPEIYTYDVKFTIKQFFAPWLKSTSEKQSYRDVWDKAYYRSDENKKEEYLSKPKLSNRFKESARISEANNLYEYTSTKAGVASFAFFFAWNFIRFMLELQRPDDHLFIMFDKPLSLTLIFLTMLVGLIGMLASQYIFPKYLRHKGWLYEKEYFN